MAKTFLPDADAALVAWGETFASVAGTHLTELKMTQIEVDAFAKLVNALKDARAALEILRAQSKGATRGKDANRSAMEDAARMLNLRIQGTAGVSDALKQQLGLTVRAVPMRRIPQTPQNLTANGFQDGVNALRWQRGANPPGTGYLIETRSPDSNGDWTFLATTTATRFRHAGQTPGVPLSYRVCACRADLVSPASNPATLYAATPSPGLTLMKAA